MWSQSHSRRDTKERTLKQNIYKGKTWKHLVLVSPAVHWSDLTGSCCKKTHNYFPTCYGRGVEAVLEKKITHWVCQNGEATLLRTAVTGIGTTARNLTSKSRTLVTGWRRKQERLRRGKSRGKERSLLEQAGMMEHQLGGGKRWWKICSDTEAKV